MADALFIANFVIEVLVAIAAAVGNGMVIFIIVRYHQLQTITNYLIASLATADLLVGVLGIPCVLVTNHGIPHNFYGCLMMNCSIIILTHVSIFCLLAVAMERFVAIKYPFFYQNNFTSRSVVIIVMLEWTFGSVVGLVPLVWNLGPPKGSVCNFIKVIDFNYRVYFGFLGFILTPLLIIMGIYVYIFHVVRKQIRQIASLEVTNDPSVSAVEVSVRRESKAAKKFALVIGVFALCWLPLETMNLISHVFKKTCVPCVFIGVWLSHANSAINPLLYAYGNSAIQKALTETILCRTRDRHSLGTIVSNSTS